MVQSIKGKTSNTTQRSQPKTAAGTKKRSLTGGKGAKSASRAKSTKASSSTAAKGLKGRSSTGAKKSVAAFTKEAGNFVRKHNLEEGIKGALIEFIKNFKF